MAPAERTKAGSVQGLTSLTSVCHFIQPTVIQLMEYV